MCSNFCESTCLRYMIRGLDEAITPMLSSPWSYISKITHVWTLHPLPGVFQLWGGLGMRGRRREGAVDGSSNPNFEAI